MKKAILIFLSILLTLILSIAVFFFVWGDIPQFKNFDEVSADYELIANFALDSYDKLKPHSEYPEYDYIHIDLYEDGPMFNDSYLSLTDEQKSAFLTIEENFYYLRVYKNAVFFVEDETQYYGLVYSKHPILALYKDELIQSGRTYHRINSRWYEWGAFGI